MKLHHVKIDSKVVETITTETYSIKIDGELFIYIDYLNDKSKVIDSILRDALGNDIDDPVIMEKILNAIDIYDSNPKLYIANQ